MSQKWHHYFASILAQIYLLYGNQEPISLEIYLQFDKNYFAVFTFLAIN